MTGDWKAVATAIGDRLNELGLELRELARRSQVSESTLRELRYNTAERRRSTRTLSSVSAGLDWPPDYLSGILEGTPDATAEPPSSIDSRLDSIDRRLDEMQTLLVQVARDISDLRQPDRGDRDAAR